MVCAETFFPFHNKSICSLAHRPFVRCRRWLIRLRSFSSTEKNVSKVLLGHRINTYERCLSKHYFLMHVFLVHKSSSLL